MKTPASLLAIIGILALSSCGLVAPTPDLVVGVQQDVRRHHPHWAEREGEVFVARNLYATLVSPSRTLGKALPGLAASWEADAGYSRFTFFLRDEAVWSDGTTITAGDVRAAWLALLAPENGAPNAWYAARYIDGAREYANGTGGVDDVALSVLDDHTLQVGLDRPLAVFPLVVGHHAFAVVADDEARASGPYRLRASDEGALTLLRNRRYFDADAATLRRVLVREIGPKESRPSALEAGSVDWVVGNAQAVVPGNVGLATPLPALDYLLFGVEAAGPTVGVHSGVADPRVRRALSLVLDRSAIVKQIPGNLPAQGIAFDITSSDQTGAAADQKADQEAYIREARELLAAAGYPEGEAMPPVARLINRSEEQRRLASVVAGQWSRALGVDTLVREEDWPTYLNSLDVGTFAVARVGWLGYYPDALAIFEAFESSAEAIGGRLSYPQVDRLLIKARTAPPGPDRNALLARVNRILVDDEATVIPLFHPQIVDLVDRSDFVGWENPLRGRHSLLYLRPQRR